MTAEKATAVLAGILCCGVLVSARQAIHLEFNDGRVWLLAHDAPVRDILREWARASGATIVNGDAVEGGPVTLELAGVPEREALEVVLRDVPGYVLAARPVSATGSVFHRILIVPKTTVPRASAPAIDAGRQPDTKQHDNGLPEPLAVLLPEVARD